jgi:2-keto-4-pentenoate hydratase
VDSRIADWRIRLADTVADLASNGAIVMSSRLVPATGLDFRTIAMTLTCDGRVIGEGTGAEALGDPVTVLTWLANVLGSSGVTLEAGHVIMTGALHAAVPISPGETYRAEFDLLGSLTVSSAAVTV